MNNINVNMANMGPMGGPVGGQMPLMNNGAGVAPQGPAGGPRQLQINDNRTLLNTYIYEYFLRYGMFDCARAILNSDSQVKVQKDSPSGRRDENGNRIGGGLGDDPMDTDSKDDMDHKRPDDLPRPQVPMPLPDSCFLYEWFSLFWDMLNAQKGKGSSGQVNQYVSHTQQQSRLRQEQQQNMLRSLRPDGGFAQQNFMMRGMQNGMNMTMGMKPGNQLPRTAMANSQNNPQAMHMMQAKAGQMQRDPSDMDGNRARPASPGSTDNAPSPSKRPRLEGGPFNPAQGVMLPNGRPAAPGMPGQQAKVIATYAANLQQHHGAQMPNKQMPNAAAPGQPQGSPMVPQGPEGAAALNFAYGNPEIANMRAGGGPPGTAPGGSNHALQDYQMQLMLLEQQNKKRLMMARQEQDVGGPRADGPGGPGVPGGPGGPGGPGAAGLPAGPNAQAFQGASPQAGRSGASPNPGDQMKRGNQQLGNAANMGSPAPDGAQSRDSPNPINFISGNQMDPMKAPNFYNGINGMDGSMMTAQINGGMRPPGGHPGQPFNGQMTPQMLQARQQAAAQGGPQMQWPGGPNGGQMPPQGGPSPQMQGTPQQRSAVMPPPSAPPAVAAAVNNTNSRNTTSSPQVSSAAPPTPSQANKAAPKKKDNKSAKSKAAAQKKSNAGLTSGATPAADAAQEPEPPTPATPMTPVAPGFNKAGQNAGAAPMVPNGQPAAAPPVAASVIPPPQPDPSQSFAMGDSGGLDFGPMDFANPLQSGDVLNDFDFDSFLHDGANEDPTAFDFNPTNFMEGGEIGAE